MQHTQPKPPSGGMSRSLSVVVGLLKSTSSFSEFDSWLESHLFFSPLMDSHRYSSGQIRAASLLSEPPSKSLVVIFSPEGLCELPPPFERQVSGPFFEKLETPRWFSTGPEGTSASESDDNEFLEKLLSPSVLSSRPKLTCGKAPFCILY